jgi:photosystem II stability/assembly factor-like uncharacterized protein
MSKLRDMKKRFLPLSMLLITIVLAQASFVANAAGDQGKYTPRNSSEATFSSFMKSIRANQETGLIDPALMIAGQQAAQSTTRDANLDWVYAGPDNFGGMTRGIVYNADGTVVIGTMGGDIYKTTNGGITFKKMTSMNLIISCMVKDANGNIFIGTGDGRNAQRLNGLSVLGHETSFVGNGIYMMAAGSTTPQLLEATTPTATNGWGFVNEMVYVNNKLYAATAAGIMMSADNGASWTNLIAGNFRSVKANNNGDIMAADDANVYLSKAGAAFVNVTDDIASNTNPKVIAMSPSDPNYMYIAYLNYASDVYSTGNIYFTNDGGTTWGIAMAANDVYKIFGDNADYDGFMIVYPNEPRKLLIGSDNLWLFEDEMGLGVNSYRPNQISEYYTDEYTAIAWNRYIYLHQGIQNIVFDPTNPNVFYVGTDGGIYKGEYYQSIYSFKSSNRYFLTEDEHTSVARMMSVGIGGSSTVIGGSLDHGTIGILGSENTNNVTTGTLLFPHITNNQYASSYFTKSYAGGPCAISTIDPDIMFVSGTGSLSTPIYRTQTAGEDFDGNFEGGGDDPVITNSNAFRTPYVFWETYEDNHHSFEVKDILDTYNYPLDTLDIIDTLHINSYIYVTNNTIFVVTDTAVNMYNQFELNDTLYETEEGELYIYNILHDYLLVTEVDMDTLSLVLKADALAGDECVYYSKQAGYPIIGNLPEPPHDEAHINPAGGYMWLENDTVRNLHDPLKSNYIIAVEGKVYMTRDALIFDKPTDWLQISTIDGIPTAVAISADGTTAYVGTAEGNFYKFNNINDAFVAEQASVTDTLNICVTMQTDATTFAGRAITSISVSPTDNNKVLVTLGNYGNTNYVYVSNNAGASFSPVAGLPAVPVYSSIIEKSTGLYIVGTEVGIYTSENGTTWNKSGNFSCPIMDLKQAIMANHDGIVVVLYDEMGNPTYVLYPGIYNEGMIYAATYGSGILECGTYKEGGDLSVDENEMAENGVQLNVYPNPIRNNGNINITLTEGAKVSYQIYDLSGRMVAGSELGYYGQGNHTLSFSTENLANGSYIIRVLAGSKSETAKILVY